MYTRTLRPSPVKHIYKFASHKNGNVQTVESSLEFNACFHFEYANEVKSFVAQPEGFYYQFEDRTCSYTPDFELFCHSGKKVFVEIKPPPEALKHDFIQRFTAKKKAVEMLGKELILVTDHQISSMPKLKNLKLINRYAGLYTEVVSRKKIYELIKKSHGLSIADISELCGADSAEVLVDVMWLVASGKVLINIDETFGCESLIWFGGGK